MKFRMPSHSLFTITALLSFVVISNACTELNGEEKLRPAPGLLLKSDLQRDMNPQVSVADRIDQVNGNNTFALDMFRRLSAEKQTNQVFSPHSISSALAMAYAGARSQTEQQMQTALRYRLNQAQLHPFFNELDLALMSRGAGEQASDGGAFRLRVANSIWAANDLQVEPDYLDTLALNYGAGLHLMDFVHNSAAAVHDINSWISEQTEQRIPHLLGDDALDENTRMVLTNAIYFNGAWEMPFESTLTSQRNFTPANGPEVQVATMHNISNSYEYLSNDQVTLVGLPYAGWDLRMYVIMPSEGSFAEFAQNFDASQWSNLQNTAEYGYISLYLPKWETAGQPISLKEKLAAMGMADAFSPNADFSGMTSTEMLNIGDIVHQAFIKVGEEGTEAAAATAVTFDSGCAPEPDPEQPIEIHIDHPFIYLIEDHPSGQILFVGQVLNPLD